MGANRRPLDLRATRVTKAIPGMPGHLALAGQTCPPGVPLRGFSASGGLVCGLNEPTSCGNGVLDSGEEFDPAPGPFGSAPVSANTCRFDFSQRDAAVLQRRAARTRVRRAAIRRTPICCASSKPAIRILSRASFAIEHVRWTRPGSLPDPGSRDAGAEPARPRASTFRCSTARLAARDSRTGAAP